MPISTELKPNAANAWKARASLSKPAARPTGCLKFNPMIEVGNAGTLSAYCRRKKFLSRALFSQIARALIVTSWAFSGDSLKRSGLTSLYMLF